MDEKLLLNRVQYLANTLFINNPEGREFIGLMKQLHMITPTFPQPKERIEVHGGPLAWAAFREGQLTLLHSLEVLAQNYNDKIAADNQVKKESNK